LPGSFITVTVRAPLLPRQIIIPLLRVLMDIHALNIVHRDIK
jgi:hypothetical protein